jgi:hypothetical protein
VFGRKKVADPGAFRETHADAENEEGRAVLSNPQGRAMAPRTGRLPNPNVLRGQEDMENTPTTFNLFGTRWCDVQMKNGLANGVASGKRWGYRGAGWYDTIVPSIPGQMRQYGVTSGSFVPKAGAPSQWQQHYNDTAGSQPLYPGGVGQVMGTELINPGSGG